MPPVTVRLTGEHLRRLDAFAESRGIDRSKAVRSLLVGLESDEPDEVVPEAPAEPVRAEMDEVLLMLSDAARDGSVTAMRSLMEWHVGHEPDELDRLIGRREDRRAHARDEEEW